jgi:alcohol dehydrogenase (NADP+)
LQIATVMTNTTRANDHHDGGPEGLGRRQLLLAGAGLSPLLAASTMAPEPRREAPAAPGPGPYPSRAWAANQPTGPLTSFGIERRLLGPHDVLLDVLFCGVCHSDIHQARDEWKAWGPTTYPCVPGHEIIGRVAAVGAEVSKFAVGEIGGVGCLVDSCRVCDPCVGDREQNCVESATYTYNSPDRHGTAPTTYGGYADKVVVTEHFVIRIPPGADLAATAPLLCAGVTTFSPMQHWRLTGGLRVGVVGLGGLGHMAVKLAVARHAEVTVFTTSPGKRQDAVRLGAKEAVLWDDVAGDKRLANSFDLIISTVPKAYPMGPFVALLRPDATLVNVGAMDGLTGVTGNDLVKARTSIAGSLIGGIAETQQVIDYCTARNIKADIELIAPEDINQAFDRVVKKDVRYRFVIDLARGR